MSKKTSRFLAVAAASLALSLGSAFAAQPSDGPGGPGMGHGGWHHGGFMKELNQLHGQLKLNADQEKSWQAALDTMKQSHEAERANHEQMRQQFKQLQQQPILDLNAMHAAHQQIEQKDAQLREQTATAWLNFYNGLNDQQKTTVSTALKQHFAKMAQRHEKMRERWEKHPGDAAASAVKP
ncbi:MAG TPA: periplasmic heavy metal sensor [Paraburkholderia sp.]|jgi:Spy/CpxP family protein refolding chaperone|nr:periplasmic heavy metal sensor [Paraburkholderia sp.]